MQEISISSRNTGIIHNIGVPENNLERCPYTINNICQCGHTLKP